MAWLDAKALPPVALSIAGSDSGAGAGIQADLKTFAALGVYGVTVLTVITAQNTVGVQGVLPLPAGFVREQLDSVFADFNIRAVKTGALGSAANVEVVADCLRSKAGLAVVVDPVMISKHGHSLLDQPGVDALKSMLIPLATVVTPNLPEAAALAGMAAVVTRDEMLQAAAQLSTLGAHALIIKGGHGLAEPYDLLFAGGETSWLTGERVDTPHTHGTGCTFSAAIAALLAQGVPLSEAARLAKDYITAALRAARPIGHGISSVEHFWASLATDKHNETQPGDSR